MSNSIEIRIIDPQDVDILRRMLVMFGHAFDDIPTYTANQPHNGYLQRLLESRMFVAIAALAGQEVSGLAGYVLPKFEQAQSELYIYDLAVDRSVAGNAWRRP